MAKDLKMCVLLDIYGEIITKKQYEVMDYYYNQDYSLAEISEHLNITRQGVRDSIKRAEEAILECEDKLKLSEKYSLNREKIEKINGILADINNLNNVQLRNNLLNNWTKEIADLVTKLDF